MHMKKALSALIAALLCLALISGCGSAPDEPQPTSSEPMTSTTSAPDLATGEPGTTTSEPDKTTAKPRTSTAAQTESGPAEKVVLTPEREAYPVGTEAITVTWFNGTDEDIIFGDSFVLQKWQGGNWTEEEPVDRLLFLTIGYYLTPGESREKIYPIGQYYGQLQAGRYRIAATYLYDRERPINKNTPVHQVYAEFEVGGDA